MFDNEVRRWICGITSSNNNQTKNCNIQIIPISGGCINQTYKILNDSGLAYFVKTNSSPPADFFKAEADGLLLLGKQETIRVPKVISIHKKGLCLEYIEPTNHIHSYWQKLATGLFNIHCVTSDTFGLDINNYCGSTPQVNTQTSNGYEFFCENRINYQTQRAFNAGLLEKRDISALDSLISKIESIVPLQPASLVHGDLWSGNIFVDESGSPVLIDPAVYYGWAESDLAMTRLFGGFAPEFYKTYFELANLEPGFEDRVDLYNLYHLLNHLNLFGTGYLNQVRAAYKKYL